MSDKKQDVKALREQWKENLLSRARVKAMQRPCSVNVLGVRATRTEVAGPGHARSR